MLIHHLGWGATEWHLPGEHYPKSYAKRIQVRTDIRTHSRELLGTGKLWCSSKAPRYRNRGLRTWFINRLGQAEVDDLCGHRASLVQAHHDVGWLDVAMYEILLVQCRQTGSNLGRNFQGQLYVQSARAFNEML